MIQRNHVSNPGNAIRIRKLRLARLSVILIRIATSLLLSVSLSTVVFSQDSAQLAPHDSKSQLVEVAYSFSAEQSGGVAAVSINPRTGQIHGTRRLLDSAECREPLKVRRAADGTIAVSNLDEDGPHLFTFPINQPERAQSYELGSVPDEVRFAGPLVLATCDKDSLAAVHYPTRRRQRVLLFDEMLDPPANAPEDIYVTDDTKLAVISFQKDSRSGRKKGSRLVLLRLPELQVVADLALPRNHPELHIQGNRKQQGPGPEVIHVDTSSDTLAVTLDLYGAIGLMSWEAAQAGRVDNWQLLSTSLTGQLGHSFPDRATGFSLDRQPYWIVCNAGRLGGSCLFDLKRKSLVWKRTTPAGLEAPVVIPELKKAYSVCSGKTKVRSGDDVEKTYDPQQKLYVFDLSSPNANKTPVLEIPLEIDTVQITQLPCNPPLLLVAGGPPEADDALSNQLVVVDPTSGAVICRHTIEGQIIRFER